MNTEKITEKRKRINQTVDGYSFPNFEILKNMSNKGYQTEYGYAINYANYMFEVKDLKEIAEKESHLDLTKIPDWEFMHLGIMIWLKSQGTEMSFDQTTDIDNRCRALQKKYNITEKKPVDIKARKTDDVIALLEGVLDDAMAKRPDIAQPLKVLQDNAGALNVEAIREHFQTQLDEVKDSVNAEYFASTDTKRLSTVLTIILNDLNKFKAVKQTTRKKRVMKVRKVVPSKMVRKLKYLKEFILDKGSLEEYKLVSIAPERIVGAEVLWVYNTKTRKLGRYVAKESNGLMVKGSTLLGFDEAQSTSKKIRKPAEILVKVMEAGKVEQRTILDKIKAVASTLNGRVNKDCILVKVF